MAKKEDTKPKNDSEFNDSIPLNGSLEERVGARIDLGTWDSEDSIPLMAEESIDMGIVRGIRACRGDKPESPRKAKKKTTPK